MNNKGQTLVSFVLIIPIIIGIFALVIDLSILSIDKRHISNSIKSAIKYGLKNIEKDNLDNDLKELIYQNIDSKKITKLNIDIQDKSITIDITVKHNSLFHIFNLYNEIDVSYTGNNNKIIKR